MTKFVFTFCFVLLISFAQAQYSNQDSTVQQNYLIQQNSTSSTGKAVKHFYTELGGPGILFSANVDTRLKAGMRTGWGLRGGVGFIVPKNEAEDKRRTVATFPVGVNYVFGKPNSINMFEAGAGVTVMSKKVSVLNYNDHNKGSLYGHFEFMYRRQPADEGFSYRVGFTPIINADGDIFPFGSVSIGFAFR